MRLISYDNMNENQKYEYIFIGILIGVALVIAYMWHYNNSIEKCRFDPNPDECLDIYLGR